jgi:hypothetical protein
MASAGPRVRAADRLQRDNGALRPASHCPESTRLKINIPDSGAVLRSFLHILERPPEKMFVHLAFGDVFFITGTQ